MEIDVIRKICLSLPATSEEVKWGNDLVFSVGAKMFCVCSLDAPLKCSFKVNDEDYELLSNADGFMPAPYLARAKWVLAVDPAKIRKKEWEEYLKRSYELVKAKLTKKHRTSLGI